MFVYNRVTWYSLREERRFTCTLLTFTGGLHVSLQSLRFTRLSCIFTDFMVEPLEGYLRALIFFLYPPPHTLLLSFLHLTSVYSLRQPKAQTSVDTTDGSNLDSCSISQSQLPFEMMKRVFWLSTEIVFSASTVSNIKHIVFFPLLLSIRLHFSFPRQGKLASFFTGNYLMSVTVLQHLGIERMPDVLQQV